MIAGERTFISVIILKEYYLCFWLEMKIYKTGMMNMKPKQKHKPMTSEEHEIKITGILIKIWWKHVIGVTKVCNKDS